MLSRADPHGLPPFFGRQLCTAGALDRHRHAFGYVAVVLAGAYSEAGDSGRFVVSAGDVLVHLDFDAHLNSFGRRPAEVLNLPLLRAKPIPPRLKIEDPDEVARLAERDWVAATELVCAAQSKPEVASDWPELLAVELRSDREISLTEWASKRRLAPSTLSRGFRQIFGTTPKRYRMEARGRRAVELISQTSLSLTQIAHDCGFADQAHMCRTVLALSGLTPSGLRRQRSLLN